MSPMPPEAADANVLAVLKTDRYMGRTSVAAQAHLSMQAASESLVRLCRAGLAERKAGTSAVVYRRKPEQGSIAERLKTAPVKMVPQNARGTCPFCGRETDALSAMFHPGEGCVS